jgi:RNA polymerase sigma factor (sigma-70 family)
VSDIFEQSYSASRRLAAVRAATIATRHRMPRDTSLDLAQEALLELWRKRMSYDPKRGGWRTFSERVVANRLTSLVRRMRSERSGQFWEEPLESVLGLAAQDDGIDLRLDVARVLARVTPFDRSVAGYLVGHSAIEASRRLCVSRAALYRAIGRLRAAFTQAGLSPARYKAQRER